MKTSEANIEDLKGMVVSDGTMRSEDLIPKFLNVLKVYGKDVYDKYVGENPEVLDLSGMDDETMGWVVDELFDKLNEIAPEGYSFGSQDGDGACYGFWSVDADERKKCEDASEIKVGDFVDYDKNGKEDWNWAEVTGVNDDGTLNLHITDMDKTDYDDVDNVPVASCHKLPRFAGMTDTGHYYMDGPINLYKGGWEICVTKKDLDPSKYEFIGTIDSYEDMVQVDAYYDDNYVYDEDDESEVRKYFGIDFPEGAVTFADFKEDVVGESCVKGMVSEGWSGGFFSREDVLNAMDGGILNKDWKLEKRFGNWGCYVNQKTGRPLVMQVMVSQDRTGDWGYKPVTSDMGPVDTNIQAAKWLKPRLEQWASEDTKNAESIPEYEWHWIDKCLGKETANKDRKNLVKSLVKGDKIKLIDTVANGAVVTFIDMITPSKMRIDYNGREMSCKTSFIDHKVEGAAESKKCEAYIQPVTLYSTTRYDDAEAVQSFLRDIGGDSVTVDKQRNGDVLSVNVSGSDDDVEAFVDTYKNEYGSIVKDCEVDATGWTAPEDIYYIATEQGRKELRGESKKGEPAGETMRVDVYADRRNFDPEEFVKYVRKAGGKNGGYISVDSVVSVDVLNKANRLAQANDYKRTESKKSEDHRRKDRYGHSVRRFTAKDLSVTPDIKITKIVPPTKEDVRKCAVTKNGKFVVFFDVDSETFKLEYNPRLEGYDGMRSAAREKCSIQNLATGQTWDCTGVYTLPEWITYGGYSDYTTDHLDDPAVQAFMNPSEQMVLTQFIKPFAKDYLGVDATESKKQESEEDKPVWGVTVEYTPVNGETRKTDVAPSCYTEERAKEAAIARVTKDYGPLKDVKIIRVDRLPGWAARNIRDLVRNNKTESMSNRIENTTITEQEFSDILNAYVKEVEGNDIKPIRIEVLKTEPVEGDGTLIKLHYDARENGWSNARTYALVFGDLHKNRDNDLIYVLHDWQSGEKVAPEDIADHDWELVNNHIRPSEILNATKSSESLDPSIDVKGRGVVELSEDDYLKLSRDINSRGYCKDKDGAYNVWIGGSFKGKFPSVEAAADAGYTLVEGKRCEAQVSEKTFKQGVDEFIGAAPEGGWSDYWAMQQDWEFYKDSLCRDGVITQKQADSWSNPCTPDTFDRWQKRNGLVRRGYESKKSEARSGWDIDSKYRYIDEFENLLGMDISDARKEMGEWWTLATQDVRDSRRVYDFKRSGLGAVTLTADKNNKVVKVSGRILRVPFEFSQKKQGESKKSEGSIRETMNAIKNFARDYGQEEYGNVYGQNLESEFRSCVQSVIGDKGDVIAAWNDGGSEGYAEWRCRIKNVEGMAPDTEFMLTLVTDLETSNSWLTCQYVTADVDVLGETDGYVGDFDPFPLIDKCLKQAGKPESKKSEGVTGIGGTMYASKLKSLARKLGSFGFKVSDNIEVKDENANDKSAEYNLSAEKDGKSYKINVDIYEGKHTTITLRDGATNAFISHLGEGSSFASAVSAIDADSVKSEESKKSEARPTKQEAQIKELCKLCRNDKNVAEAVFKALTKDYNTSLDPVLAGQYLTAKWKSKLEELGGCNGWYDGFKKLYAVMGPDFVCSVLQDLTLGSSGIGCGACITIISDIYDKVVKRNESKKSESLTLKQKELKDMARYGEAEDITTISDVEAKELKKKGIETVGISRGAYGMNGALLRDSEGKKYVITARSSNLFYFV